MQGTPCPLAFLCACAVLLGACQDAGLSADDVRERGFLRAGYTQEPPYAFMDSTGRVTGESPEALRAAAEALDIDDIRWVRLDFEGLIPALEQGRIDAVAAGIYRTPERSQRVRFSRATACSGPALVMQEGRHSLRNLGDVMRTSARVAVLAGSVEAAALQELGFPDDRVLVTPDVHTALVAVERGNTDALAITGPTARHVTRNTGRKGLQVVDYAPPDSVKPLLKACSALAFRPQDEKLAAAVDAALVRVLDSPARRAILDSLGFSEQKAAQTVSPGGDP